LLAGAVERVAAGCAAGVLLSALKLSTAATCCGFSGATLSGDVETGLPSARSALQILLIQRTQLI
jgi:hypothetical protein